MKIEHDYNYGRDITIEIEWKKCMLCGLKLKCLRYNSSEDEYVPMSLCKHCIDTLFKED